MTKNTYSCRNIFRIFLNFIQGQKCCFVFHFDEFPSNRCVTNPLPLPLLLSFTAISDYLKAGEVPTSCDPQSVAAPIGIPISFLSWPIQSAGGDRSAVGFAL
jgi:hypothetical protein